MNRRQSDRRGGGLLAWADARGISRAELILVLDLLLAIWPEVEARGLSLPQVAFALQRRAERLRASPN